MQQVVDYRSDYKAHESVVCFALEPEFKDLAAEMPVPVRIFCNYPEFIRKKCVATCFVIGTNDPNKAYRLLRSLRSNAATALTPAFLLKSLGDAAGQLSDGVANSVAEAWKKAVPITRSLAELEPESLADPHNGAYRLLAFLYTRPEYTLTPQRSWRSKKVYTYPLAEAVLESEDAAQDLDGMVQRKLLAPSQLVDRLRHCPKCDGAHLHYIDTCPNCAGIDIEQKPFLHCFACGHVGPEMVFFSHNVLVCPQCTARLRHIGSDYDRPLENFQCCGCQHIFIDPAVVARCLHCSQSSDTEALVPRLVHVMQITEKGRQSARTGNMDDVFTLLDDLNNVPPAYFESILKWFLALCQRHPEEQFSLIVVRFGNLVELTDRIGRHQVRNLMDEFARRVRELIRSTDLTTRTDQQTLWLLLPKTHAAGKQTVLGRISGLKTDEGTGLELITASFHAPSEMIPNENAKLLMARLEGELTE